MESSIIIIIVILSFIWFWYNARKASEIANQVAERNCIKWNVQFLDGTVHLKSIRITRGNKGNLALKRQYQFEFNDNNIRYYGYIVMIGYIIESTIMDDIIEAE